MAIDNDFMRPYLHKKWCWDNGFFVVLKPIMQGGYKSKVKIHLVIQKNTQVGKEEYTQNSKELENKIEELYKYMYETYR